MLKIHFTPYILQSIRVEIGGSYGNSRRLKASKGAKATEEIEVVPVESVRSERR